MTVTFDEIIRRYEQRLEKAVDEALFIAASDTVAKMAERIFEKGQSVDGRTFNYSTKPISIKEVQSPKKIANAGKKSKYFSGGYKQFRQTINRDYSRVNFRLNNDFQSDFLNAEISRAENKVGKPDMKVVDGEVRVTIKRQKNIDKKRGLEKKYAAKIFEANDSERNNFRKVAKFEIEKRLRGNAQ